MELTNEKAASMPLQTLGILSMHKIGLPIRRYMSNPTYAKHRSILKAHGFDIHDSVLEIEKRS
jgi:hypothetical protein